MRNRAGGEIACAVHTRKSSEEGLEQDFNSLDAQREACEAFSRSQKHEGWKALPDFHDDGGISGATMERPALRRLLSDIEAGRVDTVVVYKVDRLTRALGDFARIVEVFDTKGVSFVSVTQQFNTTTSMGRLTLNMLLTFARFEREVTGERIRDKIAASKKKGMWMGGVLPRGYDVADRKLVVNASEAETVRHIYRRHAELGSVRALKDELEGDGIVGKVRVDKHGRQTGGKPPARGALYLMPQNRIYRGEIVHKDKSHPGEHAAIVDRDLWDEVRRRLAANRVEREHGGHAREPSLLAGLMFDHNGERMTPTHASKKGRRYRYYVSHSLIKRGRPKASDTARRVPASELERLVEQRIVAFLHAEGALHDALAPGAPRVHEIEALIAEAATLAGRLPRLSAVEKRRRLQVLVLVGDGGSRRFERRLLHPDAPPRLPCPRYHPGHPPRPAAGGPHGPKADGGHAPADRLTRPAHRVGIRLTRSLCIHDGRPLPDRPGRTRSGAELIAARTREAGHSNGRKRQRPYRRAVSRTEASRRPNRSLHMGRKPAEKATKFAPEKALIIFTYQHINM